MTKSNSDFVRDSQLVKRLGLTEKGQLQTSTRFAMSLVMRLLSEIAHLMLYNLPQITFFGEILT